MALEHGLVATPWTGDGAEDTPYQSSLTTDYPGDAATQTGVLRCQDRTAQAAEDLAPTPNVHVRYIVADVGTMDLIDANNDYLISWREAYDPEAI